MKRVMILTNSLTGGGAERSMNLVCKELTGRGWPVSLVAINSSERDLVHPSGKLFLLNRKWQGGLIETVFAFCKFVRVVVTWKPDVVILNCDLPELFGSFLPWSHKLVVVEHSNPAWTTRMALGRKVRRLLRMRDVTWVAVSSHLKIWPLGTKPQHILQNPLMPPTELIKEFTNSLSLRRIVFIGRLASTQKRPEWILEIGNITGVEVLIIGDGEAREVLQNNAREKNLRIEFKGYVNNPWAYIEAGDLLVIPSAWEGDGLVVVEAIQRGIPILISDISDFRRFQLPNKNYCLNVADFSARIFEYQNSLEMLVVPKDKKDSILTSRSLEVVGDAWESFLVAI